MSDKKIETELSQWLSTYGSLTAKRIFDRFGIQLDADELVSIIKRPMGIYHQLMLIPLKNVFNGIILEQVQDYQVYVQKLFIDYMLSSEGDKSSDSPGANTREDLDVERIKLLAMGDEFLQQETKHQQLIAKSQSDFITLTKNLQKTIKSVGVEFQKKLQASGLSIEEQKAKKAIHSALIVSSNLDEDIINVTSAFWGKLAEKLDSSLTSQQREQLVDVVRSFVDIQDQVLSKQKEYNDEVKDIKNIFKRFRKEFYQSILKVTELINFLPDYKTDTALTEENRASLYFDAFIGEDITN